jgi:SAM-dependent methyltransferase
MKKRTKVPHLHRGELRGWADTFAHSAQFRRTLEHHLPPTTVAGAAAGPILAIPPGDQMLDYSLEQLAQPATAVSQYAMVAVQQYRAAEQVLATCFPDRTGIQVLDFACGYGRLLRFLVRTVPPAQIWASDIQQDAVDFVANTFGVHGVYSSVEPSEFAPPQKFDMIWVASLFSHLPRRTFEAWLAKLGSLLTPRGVLCFSVHDEDLLPPPRKMPAEGILFAAHSENEDLERAAYGTTHVTETYVRGAVARAFGGERPCHRLRKGLAYQQDLYVVAGDPARDLSVLNDFQWGPWGWVDRRKLQEDGSVKVSGWAASVDAAGVAAVVIEAEGGERVEAPIRIERADVAAVFRDERFRLTGWEVTLTPPGPAVSTYVEMSAVSTDGRRSLLYAGPLIEPRLAWRWLGLELLLRRIRFTLYVLRGKFR